MGRRNVIIASAPISARNDRLFSPNANPNPAAASSAVDRAGPITRATLNVTLFNPMASPSRRGSTNAGSRACEVGMATAYCTPTNAATAMTRPTDALPVVTTIARVPVATIASTCDAMSRPRLSNRSASEPPVSDSSSTGRNTAAWVTPTMKLFLPDS